MQTRHIGRVGLPSGLLSGTAFLSWEKIKFYDDFSLEAPVEFGKKIEWILTVKDSQNVSRCCIYAKMKINESHSVNNIKKPFCQKNKIKNYQFYSRSVNPNLFFLYLELCYRSNSYL